MTAPERIWAAFDQMYPEQNGGVWWGEKCAAVEFVRADLHDATERKLAKAVEALRAIADRPSQMIWGEDNEKSEAMRDMEQTADVVLAEIEKGGV